MKSKRESVLERAVEKVLKLALEQVNTRYRKTIKVWVWASPNLKGKRVPGEVSIYPRSGEYWVEGKLTYSIYGKAKAEGRPNERQDD